MHGRSILFFEAHAVRGGAANSTEWRSHKIFASDLWSSFGIPEESQKRLWATKLSQQGLLTWADHERARSLEDGS
eukprot:50613-Pyramimonas_sp.AAC.1